MPKLIGTQHLDADNYGVTVPRGWLLDYANLLQEKVDRMSENNAYTSEDRAVAQAYLEGVLKSLEAPA
jgi:hypothetical protein